MFAPLAQTPRPPGEAGRYECIRRAPEGSVCPVGTCRRRWQSDPKVGSETSGGRGQRPPRRLSDRGLAAPPNLPTAGAGAGPGGARGWVQRGAFLAPEGRSKRSRRAGGGAGPHPWRERRARGRACRGGRGRVWRGLCRAVRRRVVRRRAGVGAARRVSCAGRALETLFLLAALAGVWARSGKKGGRAGGARAPLCLPRDEKNFFCQRNPFYQ